MEVGIYLQYPPKFRMISSSSNKKIFFTLNRNLINEFTNLCTNEEINLKFKQLLVEEGM